MLSIGSYILQSELSLNSNQNSIHAKLNPEKAFQFVFLMYQFLEDVKFGFYHFNIKIEFQFQVILYVKL